MGTRNSSPMKSMEAAIALHAPLKSLFAQLDFSKRCLQIAQTVIPEGLHPCLIPGPLRTSVGQAGSGGAEGDSTALTPGRRRITATPTSPTKQNVPNHPDSPKADIVWIILVSDIAAQVKLKNLIPKILQALQAKGMAVGAVKVRVLPPPDGRP